MPTIVYQTNPSTGAKYAYESVSYWDKEKKAPRTRRQYIGRVDPETGEIIKATKRRKKNTAAAGDGSGDSMQLREELEKKDAEIARLKKELEEMTSRFRQTVRTLEDIRTLAGQFHEG